MKGLFDVVIDVNLKKKFTWTGKSIVGHTKMEFRTYKEVIALLYAVIRLADSDYTTMNCKDDIVYKVLKHKEQKKEKKKRFVQILCEDFHCK